MTEYDLMDCTKSFLLSVFQTNMYFVLFISHILSRISNFYIKLIDKEIKNPKTDFQIMYKLGLSLTKSPGDFLKGNSITALCGNYFIFLETKSIWGNFLQCSIPILVFEFYRMY